MYNELVDERERFLAELTGLCADRPRRGDWHSVAGNLHCLGTDPFDPEPLPNSSPDWQWSVPRRDRATLNTVLRGQIAGPSIPSVWEAECWSVEWRRQAGFRDDEAPTHTSFGADGMGGWARTTGEGRASVVPSWFSRFDADFPPGWHGSRDIPSVWHSLVLALDEAAAIEPGSIELGSIEPGRIEPGRIRVAAINATAVNSPATGADHQPTTAEVRYVAIYCDDFTDQSTAEMEKVRSVIDRILREPGPGGAGHTGAESRLATVRVVMPLRNAGEITLAQWLVGCGVGVLAVVLSSDEAWHMVTRILSRSGTPTCAGGFRVVWPLVGTTQADSGPTTEKATPSESMSQRSRLYRWVGQAGRPVWIPYVIPGARRHALREPLSTAGLAVRLAREHPGQVNWAQEDQFVVDSRLEVPG